VKIDETKGVSFYFGQRHKLLSKCLRIAEAKPGRYALAVVGLNNDKRPGIIAR
jgi:hypothetical protein